MRGFMRSDHVKSDTLNLRVSPRFKLALKAAADHEQRSMVNMLEVLVAGFCESKNIAIPPVQVPGEQSANKSHAKRVA